MITVTVHLPFTKSSETVPNVEWLDTKNGVLTLYGKDYFPLVAYAPGYWSKMYLEQDEEIDS